MQVGVVREIKQNENRVAVTPEGAAAFSAAGHQVLVEHGAGSGCGYADEEYAAAGATLASTEAVWGAELVIKVKEPVESEYGYLKAQILFCYLHLAAVDEALTRALLDAGTTAIAYETIRDAEGRLPLLAPMSAVAGSMAPLMGSFYLAKFNGGRGTLMAEVNGEPQGKVVIVGDGTVGAHAARVAGALGARRLVMFGLDSSRGRELEQKIPGLEFRQSNPEDLTAELTDADLVVGAVLIQGARAPRIVSEEMVQGMPAGAVIVDVSIDQGGCIATSRPTTHADPVFQKHGVTHYCVTNMPGAYPRTSTAILTRATLPYALRIADGGLDAVRADPGFASGVNVHDGRITHAAVASALELEARYAEFAADAVRARD